MESEEDIEIVESEFDLSQITSEDSELDTAITLERVPAYELLTMSEESIEAEELASYGFTGFGTAGALIIVSLAVAVFITIMRSASR